MIERDLFDLTGKVVLATGANAGIGLGFLRGCAKRGADVVLWGRRADRNAKAVEELKALIRTLGGDPQEGQAEN